jgi:outer membrane protein OmpA-like peptidoglycan-associated protein
MKHIHAIIAGIILVSATALTGCGTLSMTDVKSYDKVIVKNLGPEANSPADDYACALRDDRLFFTSKRPTPEQYIQGDDFWFTDREHGAWSSAKDFGGKINTQNDEGAPYITPDGGTIYFTQNGTEDGVGAEDIYVATIDPKGNWINIQNLGENVNTRYFDSQPFLSPDGQELVFSSNRPGGEGGTDIWMCKRLRSGKWGPAKNLGPLINTSGDEKAPMIAPNGTDMYFSSSGHKGLGGYDIFVSTLDGKKGWTTPRNIGRPFNTPDDDLFFRLSSEEDTIFISSNREGGVGGLDLYTMAPNPFKDTLRYTYFVAGVVFDTATTMGIPGAQVTVRVADGSTFNITTERSGRFRFRTGLGQHYQLTASAAKYEKQTVECAVPKSLSYNEYRKSIGLAPIPEAPKDTARKEKESPMVFFDFDDYRLSAEWKAMLDQLIVSDIQPHLEKKENVEIRLDAYTDDYGAEDYNIGLSKKRGAAVSKYLASHGVPLANIVMNAYGETNPAASNETDEGRQRNRRVEIRIVL